MMNGVTMGELLLASFAKASLAGAAIFSVATLMGLPVNDPWFDVLVAYILLRWMLISIVNGMPEPNAETSSDWYVWAYRSLHSMAHVATAYFTHKSLWKYLASKED